MFPFKTKSCSSSYFVSWFWESLKINLSAPILFFHTMLFLIFRVYPFSSSCPAFSYFSFLWPGIRIENKSFLNNSSAQVSYDEMWKRYNTTHVMIFKWILLILGNNFLSMRSIIPNIYVNPWARNLSVIELKSTIQYTDLPRFTNTECD